MVVSGLEIHHRHNLAITSNWLAVSHVFTLSRGRGGRGNVGYCSTCHSVTCEKSQLLCHSSHYSTRYAVLTGKTNQAPCELWNSHSNAAEYSSLPGRDAVSTGKQLPKLLMNVLSQKLTDLEDKGTSVLRNTWTIYQSIWINIRENLHLQTKPRFVNVKVKFALEQATKAQRGTQV